MYRALDIFAGGGGAALGLFWAGFDEVIGIDIKMHKNYPGDLIIADALNLPVDIHDFDFIWLSPPCQKFSVATKSSGKQTEHPDLIAPMRELVKDHPYTVIENVPQAPIRHDVVLWGPSFGLEELWRKRAFETSFFCFEPSRPKMDRSGCYTSVTTSMCSNNHFYRRKKAGRKGMPSKYESKHIMGIPICFQMTRVEIGEAVSPYHAEYIARQALKLIKKERPNEDNDRLSERRHRQSDKFRVRAYWNDHRRY